MNIAIAGNPDNKLNLYSLSVTENMQWLFVWDFNEIALLFQHFNDIRAAGISVYYLFIDISIKISKHFI